MSGMRGEEVGVVVRGRYSVCGVLATQGVPTHMPSTHPVLPSMELSQCAKVANTHPTSFIRLRKRISNSCQDVQGPPGVRKNGAYPKYGWRNVAAAKCRCVECYDRVKRGKPGMPCA